MNLLLQIPVADFQEIAHLSGREVKTLFLQSVDRRIDPSPRQCLHSSCKEDVLYNGKFLHRQLEELTFQTVYGSGVMHGGPEGRVRC